MCYNGPIATPNLKEFTVIAITLNFKSIEAARKALLEIPASALVGGPEPEAEPPASTAAASSPAPAPSTAPAAEPAASVDYPTLQKAVFTLAGKSREAAAAVAQSFGVKTFKDLPADKWAAALAAVNAKLAELESA